eukprot:9488777-Pyramimonas_sp.AAC.3
MQITSLGPVLNYTQLRRACANTRLHWGWQASQNNEFFTLFLCALRSRGSTRWLCSFWVSVAATRNDASGQTSLEGRRSSRCNILNERAPTLARSLPRAFVLQRWQSPDCSLRKPPATAILALGQVRRQAEDGLDEGGWRGMTGEEGEATGTGRG